MYGTLKTDANEDLARSTGPGGSPADQRQQQLSQQPNDDSNLISSSNSTGERRRNKKKKRIYSHCHIQTADDEDNDGRPPAIDKSARRRLIAASVICLIFMIAEVIGGVLSNSLAIATDAAHLLTDFASFMISLFALWLSSRPATRKMSFGWYRAEVIGALLSVLMIWLVTGLLVFMAVERLRTGEFEIDSLVMVITASGGLLVNIIMAIALNVDGHSHGHFHTHGHNHNHNHSHQRDFLNHSHLVHMHEHDHDDDHEVNHLNEELIHDKDSVQGAAKGLVAPTSFNSANEKLRSIESSFNSGSFNGCQTLLIPSKNSLDSSDEVKIRSCKKKKTKSATGGDTENSNGRGRSNINVRAAFVHVVGDFLQSLGVLIAALVIHFEPSYAIVDPICTFLFSAIVLVTTIHILRDATNVLMEGIPDGINFIEVREKLQSLPNVIRVHNLRIWSLSLDKIAISTHLVIDTSNITSSQALKQAIDALKSSYNFFEVTIQIEEYRDEMKDCEQCQDDEELLPASQPVPLRRNNSTNSTTSQHAGQTV